MKQFGLNGLPARALTLSLFLWIGKKNLTISRSWSCWKRSAPKNSCSPSKSMCATTWVNTLSKARMWLCKLCRQIQTTWRHSSLFCRLVRILPPHSSNSQKTKAMVIASTQFRLVRVKKRRPTILSKRPPMKACGYCYRTAILLKATCHSLNNLCLTFKSVVSNKTQAMKKKAAHKFTPTSDCTLRRCPAITSLFMYCKTVWNWLLSHLRGWKQTWREHTMSWMLTS